MTVQEKLKFLDALLCIRDGENNYIYIDLIKKTVEELSGLPITPDPTFYGGITYTGNEFVTTPNDFTTTSNFPPTAE